MTTLGTDASRYTTPAEQQPQSEQRTQGFVNVGQTERLISAVAGAGMVAYGLARRGVGGFILAGIGGGIFLRGVTGHCSTYAALGIDTSDSPAPEPEQYFEHGIHVAQAMTINRSPQECYDFWKNFSNLPRFMRHLERVDVKDEKSSHWVAKGPAGYEVEWDAEIINDEPYALIAWRSLSGSDVDNAGSVRFVPGPDDRGTEVKVVLDYIPPAGRVGAAIAWLFGRNPDFQIREDLRRFKQIMEAGEIPTVEGQPRGVCGGWFTSGGGKREE
jgi:uncharacterized membrane protein